VTTAADPGPVLGSQAADNAAWADVQAVVRASSPSAITEDEAAEITAAVVPILARLVDSARADGEEAGRGDMQHFERLWRTDERERLARRIRADPGYYARLAGGEGDSAYRLGAYDYKHGLYVGDPDGPAER